MKPYTPERLTEVLDEAKRALGKKGEVIKISGCKFLISDILYIYSDSNYCEIYTKHGSRRVRLSFTELNQHLVSYPFFMVVGRGVAVNLDNISHIEDLSCVMEIRQQLRLTRICRCSFPLCRSLPHIRQV